MAVPLSESKKGLIILVVIAVLGAIGLFAIYKISSRFTTSPSATVDKNSPGPVVPGVAEKMVAPQGNSEKKDIALNTITWLDTQKNEQGVYVFGYDCNDGKCSKAAQDNRTGIAVLWAKYQYMEKVNPSPSFVPLEQDLTTYASSAIIPQIQNDFWDCRLMYDLWQSKTLSAKQKYDARAVCFRSVYQIPDTSELRTTVDNKQDVTVDLVTLNKGGKLTTTFKTEDRLVNRYSPISSDYSVRFLWGQDKNDLVRAKFYFLKAASVYSQSVAGQGEVIDPALLGIASLDLYNSTKESGYLTFAKALAEKVIATPCTDLRTCNSSAMFARDLDSALGSTVYKKVEADSLKQAIDMGYDFTGYPAKTINTGAFHSSFSNTQNFYYNTRDNGITAGLLASFQP